MRRSDVAFWAGRVGSFEAEAHNIFGSLESSGSRAITLDQSYETLKGLTLRQDEIFRQALRCVENNLFRAAHVMAWAALIDCLQSLLASDGFVTLNSARPKWSIESVEQLAESFTEHALVEASVVMAIFNKAEGKALFGMLSKRNECAHPGDYFPSFNETLGYITEIFGRLGKLIARYPALQL